MKKLLLFSFPLLFAISFAQKNEKYVRIDFSSICCGPPSDQPLINYLEEFRQKNKLKDFEIWLETGLGDEGEYALYIGVDRLNPKKENTFISGIKSIVNDFESSRNINQDGNIRFHDDLVKKDELIKKQNKRTNRYSKLVLYNPKIK